MTTYKLSDLEQVLGTRSSRPKPDSRSLRIAEAPKPFVPPLVSDQLAQADGGGSPFAVEVILIEAPAAVGKSTIAKHLSSISKSPLLDLAQTPVSTHSLVGILQSDFEVGFDALNRFHRAELPILIDALDEGRLLTGERGFEQFLETTVELLLRDRSVSNRPKLVMFGRTGAVLDASLNLSVYGPEVTVSRVEIAYFNEEGARQVIHAYAAAKANPEAAYCRHRDAAGSVFDAYFSAIAAALDLSDTQLWEQEKGRAFAGYAPVLAALGELVAQMDNFATAEHELRAQNAAEAWDVIEAVVEQVLTREKGKFQQKLQTRLNLKNPLQVYEEKDQLRLLSEWLAGGEATAASLNSQAPNADLVYQEMLKQNLPEHPFVTRAREPRNAVLGSVILGNAIASGHSTAGNDALVAELSRQPFLWRCFQSRSNTGVSIDGSKAGYLLNSLWTDASAKSLRVKISADDEYSANINIIKGEERTHDFQVVAPVEFYGQLVGTEVTSPGEIVLRGGTTKGGRAVFQATGSCILRCKHLEVRADELVLDGSIWIEAESVSSSRLDIHVKSSARFGWGGALAKSYPWNRYAGNLRDPEEEVLEDSATRLLRACFEHFGGMARPLTVMSSFEPPSEDDEPRMGWARRDFRVEFPILIRTLLDHGLGTAEHRSAAGEKEKLRVSLQISWGRLLEEAQNPTLDATPLRAFIGDLRERLGQA